MIDFTGERVVPGIMEDSRDLQAHIARYVWAMHPHCLGRTVIDIACGTGYGAQILSYAAIHVTGIDNDPETIKHAREFYKQTPTYNLGFVEGSCYDLSEFSRVPAEVVVAFETVEHLTDPELFMQQVHNILSYNGRFIVSAPWNSGSRFHDRDYTHEDLVSLVEGYFRVEETYVQEIGTETCIHKGRTSDSEHPTWLVLASKR